MGKYYINEVKCGLSEGGMACGPVSGNVVVSVNVKEGDKAFWISNIEVNGIPNFYVSEENIFDKLRNGDDDEDLSDFLERKSINTFEEISLGEYDDVIKSIKLNEDNPAASLIRYIILLTRCSMNSVDTVIAMAKGKYIDEIELSESDIE